MTPVRAIFQDTGRGWVARVPSMPGLNAQGESRELCEKSLRRLVRERLVADDPHEAFAAGRTTFVDLDGPL
jgi:hypothetical protein